MYKACIYIYIIIIIIIFYCYCYCHCYDYYFLWLLLSLLLLLLLLLLLWLLWWYYCDYCHDQYYCIYIYKCVYHVIASFISHDVPISNGWIFHWRVISQVILSVDFTWQWTMDNPNWLSTKHRYAKPTMCRSCSLETGDPGDPGETKTIFLSIYWMIFQKHPNIISKWLRVCICIFVCGTMYIYIYICIYIYIYICATAKTQFMWWGHGIAS